jgi:hypothetical protein
MSEFFYFYKNCTKVHAQDRKHNLPNEANREWEEAGGPVIEAYPRAQTFTRKASKWVFQFAALKFTRGEAGVLLRHTNN